MEEIRHLLLRIFHQGAQLSQAQYSLLLLRLPYELTVLQVVVVDLLVGLSQKGTQQAAGEGVLLLLLLRQLPPAAGVWLQQVQALKVSPGARPLGRLAVQDLAPHQRLSPQGLQLGLVLLQLVQAPRQLVPAPHRRLRQMHRFVRRFRILQGDLRRSWVCILVALHSIVRHAENVQEEHRAETLRKHRHVLAGPGEVQEPLEPNHCEEERGAGVGKVVAGVELASPTLGVGSGGHRAASDEGRHGAHQLQGRGGLALQAGHIQPGQRQVGGLEDGHQGKHDRRRSVLEDCEPDHVVGHGHAHVVHPEGHADPRIGIVALPLGLQLSEELDVLAGQIDRRLLQAAFVILVPGHASFQQVLLLDLPRLDHRREVLLISLPLPSRRPRWVLVRVVPALPVGHPLDKGDAHDVGSLTLEVREPGVQRAHLLAARNRQAHEAREQPHSEAVGGDGSVHAEPNTEQDVGEGTGCRQPVEAQQERRRRGPNASLGVVDDCALQDQGAHHVVHFHFPHRQLHEVAYVLPKELEPLDLHLEPQQLSIQALALVKLVHLSVVVEKLLGGRAEGGEKLHHGS
mmetsp:Transcript_63634/g.152132  ORF Transcript_63634/g.152132 Transcript_63634/m.152132 type:complete len:571 (-) Transcript_63634:64-1776(-)